MTKLQARSFLLTYALRNHPLVTSGDPRVMMGYDPSRSCKAWAITGPSEAELKFEDRCNCGAREHNERVREAVDMLK